MVEKQASEKPVLKLLHFSRAQEVSGRAAVTVPPLTDNMEFEGTKPQLV